MAINFSSLSSLLLKIDAEIIGERVFLLSGSKTIKEGLSPVLSKLF